MEQDQFYSSDYPVPTTKDSKIRTCFMRCRGVFCAWAALKQAVGKNIFIQHSSLKIYICVGILGQNRWR